MIVVNCMPKIVQSSDDLLLSIQKDFYSAFNLIILACLLYIIDVIAQKVHVLRILLKQFKVHLGAATPAEFLEQIINRGNYAV